MELESVHDHSVIAMTPNSNMRSGLSIEDATCTCGGQKSTCCEFDNSPWEYDPIDVCAGCLRNLSDMLS